jgi:hypothetical protein
VNNGLKQKQRHPEFQDAFVVLSAGRFPVIAAGCACRLSSAAVCWARVALEAEPAGSPRVDELAAAHLGAEPAAAERARSVVTARLRCAAADDPFPDAAAVADSAADDSSLDAVQDGCSAAYCSDDRCVPVVPTGGSCRDDY